MTDKTTKKADEKRFNDTLKRMLKTPPKPKVSRDGSSSTKTREAGAKRRNAGKTRD